VRGRFSGVPTFVVPVSPPQVRIRARFAICPRYRHARFFFFFSGAQKKREGILFFSFVHIVPQTKTEKGHKMKSDEQRAYAHYRWADRYNRYNQPKKAAAAQRHSVRSTHGVGSIGSHIQ
jgi:hypothetical protein